MIFDPRILLVPQTTHMVNICTGKDPSGVSVCVRCPAQTDPFSLFPCSVYCVDLFVTRSPPHTHTHTPPLTVSFPISLLIMKTQWETAAVCANTTIYK